MTQTTIPFNRPHIAPSQREYIDRAICSGHVAGDGPFTKACHALLEQTFGAKTLLTTSCTHALEMAALLLDIAPGDEVIIPDFTFVSTANAFVLRGARPIFSDVRPDTLNLDETRLEALITAKTRAIVPVHYAGVSCDMDVINGIAQKHGIAVVEDNAHGLFGTYKGRQLGTLGTLATQSFHETKNFSAGEGGALVINDPQYVERAEILREKGTDRNRFFRGQVDKYTWTDVGSSFLMSDVLAAYLLAQLEARSDIQSRRRAIWERYASRLTAWSNTMGVSLPTVPPECGQSYHMFYLILPSLATRQDLIAHLKGRGIASVFHYLPLHLSPMGERFGGKVGDCPVTEDMSNRLLRLPFFADLGLDDVDRVSDAILEFRG